MSSSFLGFYLGWAGVYAVLGTTLLLAALHAMRGPGAWRAWPLAASTLFFVALTQHPFPDRTHLSCPVPDTQILLRPFRFLGAVADRVAAGVPVWTWFGDLPAAAVAMNFVLCALIGAALSRHATRLRWAVLFGSGLSLGVELTQLTGIWGLYPCPYRQFDVDDLILNTGGVVLGFLCVRALDARARAPARGAS